MFSIILVAVVSYYFHILFTNPNSYVYKRLPRLKSERIEFFPNIRITVKGRIVHLHHWLFLSIIFVISVVVNGGILDAFYTKGYLLGGIVQGFTFPDWKSVIVKKEIK